MDRALREFLILGVKTSIPLHRWLMAHPAVRSGEVDTGWLEREWSTPSVADADLKRAAIAAALLANGQRSTVSASISDGVAPRPRSAWRLAGRQAGLN
jgi:acetyl-CoA/propionyl-CoA carboxylase, biotin carboxylase, biotin carboxyl carrier protein